MISWSSPPAGRTALGPARYHRLSAAAAAALGGRNEHRHPRRRQGEDLQAKIHRVGTQRSTCTSTRRRRSAPRPRDAATLPEGEDEHEWLAVNTVDFFNEINLLYGIVAEFCTEQACPDARRAVRVHVGRRRADPKPIAVSAPRYVDYLMTWVQNLLDDEKVFPTELGVPFPKDFFGIVQTIFAALPRVRAHLLLPLREDDEPRRRATQHVLQALHVLRPRVQPHSGAQELAPLQELIDKLMSEDAERRGPSAAAAGPPPEPPRRRPAPPPPPPSRRP